MLMDKRVMLLNFKKKKKSRECFGNPYDNAVFDLQLERGADVATPGSFVGSRSRAETKPFRQTPIT